MRFVFSFKAFRRASEISSARSGSWRRPAFATLGTLKGNAMSVSWIGFPASTQLQMRCNRSGKHFANCMASRLPLRTALDVRSARSLSAVELVDGVLAPKFCDDVGTPDGDKDSNVEAAIAEADSSSVMATPSVSIGRS